MLRELRINNVAIIEDLAICFGPGLNVITGETGAGKSVLLRALGLLCGARAGVEVVRGESETATVEGIFDFEIDPARAEEIGLDRGDDDIIIIRRQVSRSGKGRSHINGSAASASMLRQLGRDLVHLYGQHDQALLLRPTNHLDFLDQFGGILQRRHEMQAAFAALVDARRQLNEFDERSRGHRERRELLEFQRSELADANLIEGEDTQLRLDRERLRHAERIAQVCNDGESDLYSATGAMVSRLDRLASDLQELATAVPGLASPAELVEHGKLLLEEAALQLRTLAATTRDDPSLLDDIEERLALLIRLGKKYGAPASELPAILARVEAELGDAASHAADRERSEIAAAASLQSAVECATALSTARAAISTELSAAMRAELADLGMENGDFKVLQETSVMQSIEDLGPSGADRLEFLLSANRGESPQPLARVASGGELSRILLALKSLTAESAETPILIFDEVDAGIGGSVADAVARKLRLLAQTHQVLCITHLPQIAAGADHHFVVEKSEHEGRTVSETRALAEEERIVELSRMLGGATSDEAASYARELRTQGRETPRETQRETRRRTTRGRPRKAPRRRPGGNARTGA